MHAEASLPKSLSAASHTVHELLAIRCLAVSTQWVCGASVVCYGFFASCCAPTGPPAAAGRVTGLRSALARARVFNFFRAAWSLLPVYRPGAIAYAALRGPPAPLGGIAFWICTESSHPESKSSVACTGALTCQTRPESRRPSRCHRARRPRTRQTCACHPPP